MERIPGDHRVEENPGVVSKELLSNGQFAVILIAAVAFHKDGAAVVVAAEGDDGTELVAKIFAVNGKALGKVVVIGHQPVVEGGGEFVGVDGVDHVVDGVVAGQLLAL